MATRQLLSNKRFLLVILLCGVAFIAFLFRSSLLATWHVSRAKQFLGVREDDRALEELQAAARLDPDRSETYFLLARVYRRSGMLERVPALLRQAVDLGGDPELAQCAEWMLLAQMGRLRDAEPHLETLLSDPRVDGADICEAYVLGYFANLRVDDALRLLDLWQDQYPEDAQPFFMRAYVLDAVSQLPEAVAAYRQGLRISPNDATMNRRLAQVLIKMREFDEAESLLRHCAEESPEDRETITIWAECLFKRDKIEEARQVLAPLLANEISTFPVRLLAGQIDMAEGRFEDALPHLQAAVEQRPFDRNARYALATTLKGLGRSDEAQPHFDYVDAAKESWDRLEAQMHAATEQPENVELRFEIATTLQRFGSPDDSVRWLRNVLELQPDHPQALALYRKIREHQQGRSLDSESNPLQAESGPSEE
jgi:tetratricopeptide (TPR) repeat protein